MHDRPAHDAGEEETIGMDMALRNRFHEPRSHGDTEMPATAETATKSHAVMKILYLSSRH